MERIKSGIAGLDELLQGGFPQGSSVLVTGGSGTGKTILSMQYIYAGAKQFSQPGVFVTVESSRKTIEWDMVSFNWGINEMQEKNLISIYRMNLGYAKDGRYVKDKVREQLELISRKVNEMKAQRLVIDSTTAFAVWMEAVEFRPLLFDFLDKLKDLNCTTLFTAETAGGKTTFSAFGVEEFIADGVIALYFTPPNRSIFIRKMRGTAHDKSVHPFEITNQGIIVKPKEQVMWEAIK